MKAAASKPGKEWAKGKVEAGKQWVRGKVEAGKAAVTGKGTARTAPEDAARHQRIGQEAAGRLTSAKSLDLKDFEKRARAVERDLGPQVRPGATLKVKHGEPKSQSASGHLPFSVVIAPNTTIVPDEATLEHMGEIARELKADLQPYSGTGEVTAHARIDIPGYPGYVLGSHVSGHGK